MYYDIIMYTIIFTFFCYVEITILEILQLTEKVEEIKKNLKTWSSRF